MWRPPSFSTIRLWTSVAFVLCAASCSATPPAAEQKQSSTAQAPGQAKPSEQPVAAPAEQPLPPAPDGAVTIGKLYVQTCAQAAPCPELLQAAGATHCEELTLGGLSWRLPTLTELESWKGNAALSGYDVFHWSGTEWEEGPGQVWIYDPGTGSKTTTKPDRKPFTIRCVADGAK